MPVLDSFGLGGRVAVVTGGNRGLGRAFAQALGEAGASIAILARDSASNDAAVHELTAQGVPARAFRADVAQRREVDQAVTEIVTALGRVDILINNAGTCIHRPALEVTEAEWREVIDVNLTGVWDCCQALGRGFAAGGGGPPLPTGSKFPPIRNTPPGPAAPHQAPPAGHPPPA